MTIWRAICMGAVILIQSEATFANQDQDARRPLALIWKGSGVCRHGCEKAAAKVARKAGFRTRYVTEKTKEEAPFTDASVWVQPGGGASAAARAMGPALLERIRNFVRAGGGYVGFCAGGFLATDRIGSTGNPGLGIVPGTTRLLLVPDDLPARLLRVQAERGRRSVYYAGGPYLTFSDDEAADHAISVTARYGNGTVAAIQSEYGSGRVAVSGFHPEATWAWKFWRGMKDRDGSDHDIAIAMMKYAGTQ